MSSSGAGGAGGSWPDPTPGAPGALCSPDGWCWYNPLPQGDTLYSTWVTAPNDVWAVGAGGTILHYDGTAWSRTTLPSKSPLTGVWASVPSDVWAVAQDGTIAH